MSKSLAESARIEEAWTLALYNALCRFGETPIFRDLAAEMGNPLSVEVRAS